MFHGYLRQSTAAQVRLIGAYVDSTDGFTPETGLTIANTDIKLSKNGGATADKNSGGGTHIASGMYAATFDATDSNTVGELTIISAVVGARVVYNKFFVLEEAIYDALFAAGAAGNEIADAVLNRADGVESNYTLKQALRLVLSVLVGKVSGSENNAPIFRDVNDTKARVSATTDANGNRSTVTKDVS